MLSGRACRSGFPVATTTVSNADTVAPHTSHTSKVDSCATSRAQTAGGHWCPQRSASKFCSSAEAAAPSDPTLSRAAAAAAAIPSASSTAPPAPGASTRCGHQHDRSMLQFLCFQARSQPRARSSASLDRAESCSLSQPFNSARYRVQRV